MRQIQLMRQFDPILADEEISDGCRQEAREAAKRYLERVETESWSYY
jgi:hypothetical protein